MARRRWRLGRLLWLAIPLAVAVVAWTNRRTLVAAFGLIREASLGWFAPAVLAIAGVYLCRGTAYGVPLRVLGYTFPRSFLWNTALVSSAVNQLIPSGGGSGYAFLTYALHQRGASGGQASLVGLIDTLSYAFALATLVVVALVGVAVWGGASPLGVLASFGPVAMAGVSVVSAPGGGGSFEAIMSVFFRSYGVEPALAIAATLLYRVVAFWLPVAASLGALQSFRRRRRELRRARP